MGNVLVITDQKVNIFFNVKIVEGYCFRWNTSHAL